MQTITTQEPIPQWESMGNPVSVQEHEEAVAATEVQAVSLAQKTKKLLRRIDHIRRAIGFVFTLFPLWFVFYGIKNLSERPTMGGWITFVGLLPVFSVITLVAPLFLSLLIEGILALTLDRWDKYKIKKAFYLALLFVGTIFPVMALFGWFHVLWLQQNPTSLARCVEMVAFIATAGLTLGPLLKWLNHKEKTYDSAHS